MKKHLIISAVAVMCATNAHAITVMGAECEQIATGIQGDILVKCAQSPELLEMQAKEADCMFQSVDINFDEIAQDTENIYVNIDKDECGPGTTGYRVMVKNPIFDGTQMYAVDKCE